jgi:hypothetical protein
MCGQFDASGDREIVCEVANESVSNRRQATARSLVTSCS